MEPRHTHTHRVNNTSRLPPLSSHTGVSGILAQTPEHGRDKGREINNNGVKKKKKDTVRDEEEVVPLKETGKEDGLIWRETRADGRTEKDVRIQADKKSL